MGAVAHLKTKGDVIASLMIEGFGAVPVVDAKESLGIVSEHDLLAAMDDGHKLGAVAAGDIMTCNPYSIHPEATLPTLIHVFRASDLIRVPVVDAKDKLVGIIARRDVLRAYLAAGRVMLKMTPSFVLSRSFSLQRTPRVRCGRRAPCGLAGMSF